MSTAFRYSASQLANLLGHFGAQRQAEAMASVWQNAMPQAYEVAVGRHQQTVKPLYVPANLVQLSSQPCTTAAQVESTKRQLAEAVAVLPSAQQAPILEQCVRKVQTEFGKVTENSAIARFQQAFGQTVLVDSSLKVAHIDGLVFQGRIDGLLEDGTVIEVKNRVNRLFRTVREYERMQVLTYLELLDRPSALLVESYKDQLLWHRVDRDTVWWRQHVLAPLQHVHARMCQIPTSVDKQEELFATIGY